MIDYQAMKVFTWFVKQVTEAHRTGDVDKSKARGELFLVHTNRP